ncbi:PLC-like phosphodiesterase [Dactylonectria macrodidyma]|uniref:PLC-like phosphodiesterase n=1 Tax=Dactylonectria macrodidyma TaxID=307937 RepID=A0A9P9FR64_9HYPO|nr:PLC-like phosphodiesterase [Dactylonectria macrodidyma]
MLLSSLYRSATAGALALLAGVASVSAATACNNSPSLCSRNYNNITHMGAHGSSFLRDGTSSLAAAGNQFNNATVALDAGIRLLQAQVHKPNSTLRLCHTSCGLLDAGTLEDWLVKINYWMSQNPNEVVTILLVNSDDAEASEFGAVFNSSGISDWAYTPSSSGPTSDWPTLTSMISSNQRVVSFVTNIDASTDYAYLMPEFDYVFETAFEVASLDGFNCTLDRPSSADSASEALSNNFLSLANHFKYQSLSSTLSLYIPDVSNIETVNSANTTEDGMLGLHLDDCKTEWGVIPNFVLVDLFEEGDVFTAVDRMNDISDATGRAKVASDDESKASGDKSMGPVALVAFVAAAIMLV